MAFDPFTAGFDLAKTILAKWLPDANVREEAARELATQLQTLMQGQIALNLKEAESNSFFIAGWRPACGWLCVVAYAWSYIVQPGLTFILTSFQVHLDIAQLPQLNMAELGFLLLSLLGIGTLRTYEKTRGVS